MVAFLHVVTPFLCLCRVSRSALTVSYNGVVGSLRVEEPSGQAEKSGGSGIYS